MQKIRSIVNLISGKKRKSECDDLSFAIYIAFLHQPNEIPLKAVFKEMKERKLTTKSVAALERSISRVADDVWCFGNRETLNTIYGREVIEKPMPKDLVYVISQYCWIRKVMNEKKKK